MSVFDDLSFVERRVAAFEAPITASAARTEPTTAAGDEMTFRAALDAFALAPGAAAPLRPSAPIADIVSDAARRYGLDPSLLESLVRQESGFDPAAVSGSGAMGLTQLMPETAAQLGVADPFDAAQNVDGGARYLRGLLDRFHGDARLAVAAYNAGPGAVERYGDVPPYPETQSYVLAVLGGRRRP